MILIVVRFATLPEWTDRWIDLTADFTAATRAEPGNLFLDRSRSVDNPAEFVLVEGFRDAGAAHVASEHFQRAVESLPEALAATPSIISQAIDATDWNQMAEMRVVPTS